MCQCPKYIFIFLLLLCTTVINAHSKYEDVGILTSELARNYLNVFDFGFLLQNYVSKEDENSTCSRDLSLLKEGIPREEWALKMIDASSKIPTGLLEGNIKDLGMYDECLSIEKQFEDFEIRGRHCMYNLMLNTSQLNTSIAVGLTLSVCVPRSCEANNVVNLLNRLIRIIKLMITKYGVTLTVTSAKCSPVNPEVWDTETIVWLSILIIYICLLTICTICDLIYRRMDDELQKHYILLTLSKFSFIKNGAMILSTKTKEGNLPTLHGIRALSIFWVALGHKYLLYMLHPNVNALHILKWLTSWNSLYLFLALFSVDTFFTISGFLLTYIFLKRIPEEKSFNIIVFYLHRFIRLTPAVLATLVITNVFVPKMGSGPLWDQDMDLFVKKCGNYWWGVLLYIPNYLPDEARSCALHLWYLAADMQLFWISPIILFPLYRKPKIGFCIILLLSVISIIVTAILAVTNEYQMVSMRKSLARLNDPQANSKNNMFKDVYIQPYCRALPWFVGVVLGYELANKKRNLRKSVVWFGWLLAIAAFTICILGMRYFLRSEYEFDVASETIFGIISKPLWGFGICWVIYASIYKKAGPLATFLNWKFFLPISRLSYCIYCVHMIFLLARAASIRVPQFFSDYLAFDSIISDFCVIVVIAFFFSLCFESPILALERMLLKNYEKSQHVSQEELTNSCDTISTVAYNKNGNKEF